MSFHREPVRCRIAVDLRKSILNMQSLMTSGSQVQADTQAVENIKAQMQEAKNQIDQLLQNQPQ